MSNILIGIAGGSGSGKSTFASKIREQLRGKVSIIKMDNYYKPLDHISLKERSYINFDSPEAFDIDLLFKHLQELKSGNNVNCPLYDFELHTRKSEQRTIYAKKVIIVEGIFVLAIKEIRDLLDMKIYVDGDSDERLIRRILRDVKWRGRELNDIVNQYTEFVKSMHEIHIEPSKKFADIILNGGKNDVAIDVITSKITQMCKYYNKKH